MCGDGKETFKGTIRILGRPDPVKSIKELPNDPHNDFAESFEPDGTDPRDSILEDSIR